MSILWPWHQNREKKITKPRSFLATTLFPHYIPSHTINAQTEISVSNLLYSYCFNFIHGIRFTCVCIVLLIIYIYFLLFIVQYHKCFFVNSKIFSFHWILQSETIKCFRHAIIYEMSSSRAQEPNLITSFSFFPLSHCCCCCSGFKYISDMSSDNAKNVLNLHVCRHKKIWKKYVRLQEWQKSIRIWHKYKNKLRNWKLDDIYPFCHLVKLVFSYWTVIKSRLECNN